MARIFLVEDNESIREAVAGYLRLEDHEVVEFGGVAACSSDAAQRTRTSLSST